MVSVQEIDAILPQTQCQECGFKGCRPYAEALVNRSAPIDLCPPGGVETLRALGEVLHIDPKPYEESIKARTRKPSYAVIREEECIGCTKCIQACPVDAIVGSAKLMHSVLTRECTGCELCVAPCPVDCIEMVPQEESCFDPNRARDRYHAREVRQLKQAHEKQQVYRQKRQLVQQGNNKSQDKQAKKDYILQALARVKAKK